jgi:hypothetical protein
MKVVLLMTLLRMNSGHQAIQTSNKQKGLLQNGEPMKLQRLGGYASICSMVVMIIIFFLNFLKAKRFGALSDPRQAMVAYSDTRLYDNILNVLLIVVYALCLIFVLALYERMQDNARFLSLLALISASAGTVIKIALAVIGTVSMGIIAQAGDVSAFKTFSAMMAGVNLTGGHLFGWAFLFLGFAAIKTRAFSRALSWLLLINGIVWLPAFMFTALIPLVYLVNIGGVWIGIVLLREKQPVTAARQVAASK